MLPTNGIIQILLPILYGFLVGCSFFAFFKDSLSQKLLYRLTIGVVVVHAIYIGTYTISTGHCLLTTSSEIFSLIAFTIMMTYLIVELRPTSAKASTGLMVLIVAFVFQLFSSLVTKGVKVTPLNPIFLDPVFNAHVATIVFGYAALTLSTIYGSLYLLLYRAMKRNQFGIIFRQLPSLSRLERYGIRSLGVGFVFLSASIIFGVLLINRSFSAEDAQIYLRDAKTIATILIWIVFGTTLLVRKVMHIEGHKLVVLWLTGYALTLISSTVLNALGTDYHHFF